MSVTAAELIRPFTIPVASRAELNDLRARIKNTRWPDREPVISLGRCWPLTAGW